MSAIFPTLATPGVAEPFDSVAGLHGCWENGALKMNVRHLRATSNETMLEVTQEPTKVIAGHEIRISQ